MTNLLRIRRSSTLWTSSMRSDNQTVVILRVCLFCFPHSNEKATERAHDGRDVPESRRRSTRITSKSGEGYGVNKSRHAVKHDGSLLRLVDRLSDYSRLRIKLLRRHSRAGGGQAHRLRSRSAEFYLVVHLLNQRPLLF